MSARKSGINYVQIRMDPELHERFGAVAAEHSNSLPEEFIQIAKAWVNVSERDRRAFFLKAADSS